VSLGGAAPAAGPRLRVALFGSPAFALPSLEALQREHELVLVVAQPDKPAGRGLRSQAPAAAVWATANGVELAQPDRLRGNVSFFDRLRALDLDVAVTAAYGKILPSALLAIPREGVLNVHASLLPRHRGAAPVQWALIAGDPETGVSIMQTEAGLDTGPVRHVKRTKITSDETAAALMERLSLLGAEALVEALALLQRGRLPSTPQDDAEATLAPRLSRDDGRIRWSDTRDAVIARHRGVTPWPGSWFERGAAVTTDAVKVHALAASPAGSDTVAPGTVVAIDAAGVHVATGSGSVVLGVVQSPGRPRMPAHAWAHGARLQVGERCG